VALDTLPADARDEARLVFTAHSVPLAMAAASGSPSTTGQAFPASGGGRYAAELAEAARLIHERVRPARGDEDAAVPVGGAFDLVYQSRSGPPGQPWLEPDIRDHIAALAKEGVPAVVVVPVGFVTDHMEVRHDLDVEAAEAAAAAGLWFARAACPAPGPKFARMVTDLVRERMTGAEPVTLGDLGPAAGDCPADCCRYQRPGRPA
jgi:ferrochelatase